MSLNRLYLYYSSCTTYPWCTKTARWHWRWWRAWEAGPWQMEYTTVPSVGLKLHPSQRIPDQRVTLFIRIYAIRYVRPITYFEIKTRLLLFRILFVRLATKSFLHNYSITVPSSVMLLRTPQRDCWLNRAKLNRMRQQSYRHSATSPPSTIAIPSSSYIVHPTVNVQEWTATSRVNSVQGFERGTIPGKPHVEPPGRPLLRRICTCCGRKSLQVVTDWPLPNPGVVTHPIFNQGGKRMSRQLEIKKGGGVPIWKYLTNYVYPINAF